MAATIKPSTEDSDAFDDPTLYRRTVGALQYLTVTRPDLDFSINKVAQYMSKTTISHWAAVKRILWYIKHTHTLGLHIHRSQSTQLHGYTDSDWVGYLDDRHCQGGYFIYYGPNLISWSSKQKSNVSRSSTKAECRSLAILAAELTWIQMLLHEMGLPLVSSPVLWCDNIGATYLASNPIHHSCSKHVELDFHFVRDKVQHRLLEVRFLTIVDQTTDIFTKPLHVRHFTFLRDKLSLTSTASLEGAC
ncbi:PREDICTED: uncharacterized protein LOC109115409 [Nelumbo nucifera]|uniref:Uncharacterized protein LOC109115409 n=1 Tax=Nelumbo nucifera TaxID=4432 RepID=A0A1U8QA36_NELNU|nr:PREDICTED: uncharacterized protein LOC109115409 [Nelumbo nucifera]